MRLAQRRSSSLWYSSRSEQRAARPSRPSTGARLAGRSSGVAYRPWTVLTTSGTRASRAATRPITPGLGLWVWSRSKRSRRSSRTSSAKARRSAPRFQLRVALRQARCRTPAASMAAVLGPGALMPVTS